MKRYFRRKPPDTDVIDGGVRKFVDEGLPKEIQSAQITSFSCKFSSMDRSMQDTPIAGQVFTLTATTDSCTCKIRDRNKQIASDTFTPDKDFMRRLQEIIVRYDMAQKNGQYYSVSGLPPDYGIKLEVCYASGEQIRINNNQSCFLSNAAMEELVTLFQQQ